MQNQIAEARSIKFSTIIPELIIVDYLVRFNSNYYLIDK